MTLSWWALFLVGAAGALLSLGALGGFGNPPFKFTPALIVCALVLFTAAIVLALVVAGQT